MLVSMILGLSLCGEVGCNMQVKNTWDEVDQITAASACLEEKQKYLLTGNKVACYIQSTNDQGDIVLQNIETGVFSLIKR